MLVTVAVLALAAVGLGVWNGQRRKHHREFIASEVAAIEAFSAKLKVTFPTDLQPIQPDLEPGQVSQRPADAGGRHNPG